MSIAELVKKTSKVIITKLLIKPASKKYLLPFLSLNLPINPWKKLPNRFLMAIIIPSNVPVNPTKAAKGGKKVLKKDSPVEFVIDIALKRPLLSLGFSSSILS